MILTEQISIGWGKYHDVSTHNHERGDVTLVRRIQWLIMLIHVRKTKSVKLSSTRVHLVQKRLGWGNLWRPPPRTMSAPVQLEIHHHVTPYSRFGSWRLWVCWAWMNWTWYFYFLTHGFGTIDSTWFISADLKELPMCCKLRFHSLRQQTMPTFNEFNIALICQVLSSSAIEEKSWRKAASRCLLNFAKALQRCHKWPWQELFQFFAKLLMWDEQGKHKHFILFARV